MAKTNLIFLRGLARETRHWHEVLPKAGQLFDNSAAVMTLDLPGAGLLHDQRSPSQIPEITRQIRLRAKAKLSDPQDRNFLIGISMGGMVATEWAVQNGEEVAGIVLVNSSFSGLSPFYERFRPSEGIKLFSLALEKSKVARERRILDITTNLLSDTKKTELAELFSQYNTEYPLKVSSFLAQITAAARYRAPLRAPCPTLILSGGRDRLVDPRCSLQISRTWRSPLEVHPNAGHDLGLDDPDWLLAQLKRWLTRPSGGKLS